MTVMPMFLTAFLVVQIAFNLRFDYYLTVYQRQFFWGSIATPGMAFEGLKPYLSHVRLAGYFTDRTPTDPDVDTRFMYIFQRAQFALAPTMLDHYTPLQHDTIVIYVKDSDKIDQFLKQHPNYQLSVRLMPSIALVQRR